MHEINLELNIISVNEKYPREHQFDWFFNKVLFH